MKRAAAGALVLAAILFALEGCGTARRGVPFTGPHVLDEPVLAAGARGFDTYCHQCHPGGTAGIGFAINNKPLPGWLIRFQVRRGIGAMPSFSRGVISDEELDAIVAYLDWLRRLDPNIGERGG